MEVWLETPTRARLACQRVAWVSMIPAAKAGHKRRTSTFSRIDFRVGKVMIGLLVQTTDGNCPHTFVRVLWMPEADLAEPRRKGRQAEILRRPARRDDPFSYWRTVARPRSNPVDRLIETMEAAGRDDQPAFAADWWRDATRSLAAQAGGTAGGGG